MSLQLPPTSEHPFPGAPPRPDRTVPRDPDGDPRALYRPRVESPAPESVEPLKAIIQHSRPLTRVDDLPERLKVVSVAEPDAQRETPVAEMVQRDRLAGDLLDPPAGQRSDHRSEPERLGHHSNGAERHPRVSHGAPPGWIGDPIPQEQAIPAPGLGDAREIHQEPRISQLIKRRQVQSAFDGPRSPRFEQSAR